MKNSWKCCGFGLLSCWQLWFHEKNCRKNLGEKLVKGFCRNWIFGQKFDFSNSVYFKAFCILKMFFGKKWPNLTVWSLGSFKCNLIFCTKSELYPQCDSSSLELTMYGDVTADEWYKSSPCRRCKICKVLQKGHLCKMCSCKIECNTTSYFYDDGSIVIVDFQSFAGPSSVKLEVRIPRKKNKVLKRHLASSWRVEEVLTGSENASDSLWFWLISLFW